MIKLGKYNVEQEWNEVSNFRGGSSYVQYIYNDKQDSFHTSILKYKDYWFIAFECGLLKRYYRITYGFPRFQSANDAMKSVDEFIIKLQKLLVFT